MAGIEGVDNISDDIIVHGPDQKTTTSAFSNHGTPQTAWSNLNADKCLFHVDRLVFMGSFCLRKESAQLKKESEPCKNQESLKQSVKFEASRLANYSSRFIPHFATLTEPLRKLTRKDVPFHFGPEQKASFESLKQSMAEAGTLAYFDKTASTKVVADASPVGLGAVLMQHQNGAWVPICYASRSLTECERRYSQTEKEPLALFGHVRGTMHTSMACDLIS